MSLIIKAKFFNKSNNVIIDYSEKKFTRNQKEVFESGTLYRKGTKLSYKLAGALNTTDNSNENTNYMNDNRLINLLSVEKKEGPNFVVDCGEWSKDIIELLDQSATYFLYKGSTIENFMKDKHRYHILSQGDIFKIGKIYLKVLHIKLINPNLKFQRTTTNKEDDVNNNKSESNSNEINEEIDKEVDKEDNKEERSKSPLKNDLILERETKSKVNKTRNKKTRFPQSRTEARRINFDNLINNKIINRSMIMTQKLNLTPQSIDINDINDANIRQFQETTKNKKTRNKSHKKKKNSKNKNKNKQLSNQNPINIEIKKKICRICLSEETNPSKNPLICPCICKGSMKYIHYLCLKNWLNLKVESEIGPINNIEIDRPTITYSTNDICCELCKSKFPDYVKHNGKLYNVSFYKPKYDQFIVLESVRNDSRRTRFIHIIPLNNYSMHRIGRLNNCDLALPDSSISRVHCCFYIENNQLVLENNSKFGTKVLIQNPKINMVEDYPLCIETQNTYLKIYINKKFNIFSCCNASTKSQITMHPYQSQNQKGFDLFCSMVFKDDDEDDSDNEEEKEDENKNLIDDNNKESDKKSTSKVETEGKKVNKEGNNIEEQTNKSNKEDGTKIQERNLINIKINDETISEGETKPKNSKKGIKIISKFTDNKSDSQDTLINEENKTKKKDIKNTNLDIFSNKEKENLKNEYKISDLKNAENFNKSMTNLISNFDKDVKINIRETENPNEHLKQLESEEYIEQERKSIINFFNNNDLQTLKADQKDINKKSINEILKNKNYETDNNKSNKSINLDEINSLSYRREDKLEKKKTISLANKYDSIFGLIPNEKNDSSRLFAPKHNKNIKFGNYDIHFESEKVNNPKSTKKIWDKFNWNFKNE